MSLYSSDKRSNWVDFMDKSLQTSLSYLHANQETMVKQLFQFCEINSGTDNLVGLNTMLQTLWSAFKNIGDIIQPQKLPPLATINMTGHTTLQSCGEVLFIQKRPDLPRRILLCGHMDTVYPADSPFQTLTYVDENTINGPGVADMKGGLIVMLHALTAFEMNPNASNIGWDVLINADEEIGSPASSLLFSEIAHRYEAALLYEPAMNIHGTIAKNRKGSGKITLIATGVAAHAGRSFTQGKNAICFLAEALIAIHALNGLREGVTINVGLIAGGEALNIVPDRAVAKLDIRINHPDDEAWVRQQIDNIIVNTKQEGYSLIASGDFTRPVKRVNKDTEQLFQRIQKVGHEIGLTLDWEDSGGCCDGNNLANAGLPVIDTLGVRGGQIHSPKEFILIDSLVERASLSMLLLNELVR